MKHIVDIVEDLLLEKKNKNKKKKKNIGKKGGKPETPPKNTPNPGSRGGSGPKNTTQQTTQNTGTNPIPLPTQTTNNEQLNKNKLFAIAANIKGNKGDANETAFTRALFGKDDTNDLNDDQKKELEKFKDYYKNHKDDVDKMVENTTLEDGEYYTPGENGQYKSSTGKTITCQGPDGKTLLSGDDEKDKDALKKAVDGMPEGKDKEAAKKALEENNKTYKDKDSKDNSENVVSKNSPKGILTDLLGIVTGAYLFRFISSLFSSSVGECDAVVTIDIGRVSIEDSKDDYVEAQAKDVSEKVEKAKEEGDKKIDVDKIKTEEHTEPFPKKDPKKDPKEDPKEPKRNKDGEIVDDKGRTAPDKEHKWQVGPRGGWFYVDDNGNKVYDDRD